MNHIQQVFDDAFSRWGIRLPVVDGTPHSRGQILHAGWVIWYLFGRDDDGLYLDYYACHRMTNDRHVRIRDDGSTEMLPTIAEFRRCSKDPEEDARLEAEYFARNREVHELLERKGFTFTGREDGLVQVNRLLHVDPKAGEKLDREAARRHSRDDR